METEKALNQLAQDIKDARHDVRLGFAGPADMILSEALRQIEQIKREHKARHDDDRRTDYALSEANDQIGSLFSDLRDIYSPKEGSGPTHG